MLAVSVKPQGRIPPHIRETSVEPHQWGRACFQAWLFLPLRKPGFSFPSEVKSMSLCKISISTVTGLPVFVLLAWFYFIYYKCRRGSSSNLLRLRVDCLFLYLLPGHRYLKLYYLSDEVLGLRTSGKLCGGAMPVEDFGKEIRQTSQ